MNKLATRSCITSGHLYDSNIIRREYIVKVYLSNLGKLIKTSYNKWQVLQRRLQIDVQTLIGRVAKIGIIAKFHRIREALSVRPVCRSPISQPLVLYPLSD